MEATITTSPAAAADSNDAFRLSKTASDSPAMTVLMVPVFTSRPRLRKICNAVVIVAPRCGWAQRIQADLN